MSKALKLTLSVFGVIIIIFGIFVGIIFSSFGTDAMCGTKLIESKLSPNDKLKILIFSVNCGAVSDFSTQISLVKSDYNLQNEDSGNIFSADSDHGKSKMNGEVIELKTKWINNNYIEIEYPENARIFKSKANKNGVQIIYKKIKN